MSIFTILEILGIVGSGLTAGIFFAFSTFVMAAFARLPAEQGIAAMNSINVAVINPWFMAVFMGTPVLCVIIAIMVVLRWSEPGSLPVLAASAIYIVGSFGVTMFFNVPLNDALAAATPTSSIVKLLPFARERSHTSVIARRLMRGASAVCSASGGPP